MKNSGKNASKKELSDEEIKAIRTTILTNIILHHDQYIEEKLTQLLTPLNNGKNSPTDLLRKATNLYKDIHFMKGASTEKKTIATKALQQIFEIELSKCTGTEEEKEKAKTDFQSNTNPTKLERNRAETRAKSEARDVKIKHKIKQTAKDTFSNVRKAISKKVFGKGSRSKD